MIDMSVAVLSVGLLFAGLGLISAHFRISRLEKLQKQRDYLVEPTGETRTMGCKVKGESMPNRQP